MKWQIVNENYLNYLRIKERRIPKSDYGTNKYKPFFGILFEKNNLYYITQISHAQERHNNMKVNIDFKKIYDSTDNHLLAVVNLNYMFPIPKHEISELMYRNIQEYRTFNTDTGKSKYIDLLKTELDEMNKLNLKSDALEIYENKYTYPNNKLAKRCLDYKKLEELAQKWV